MLKYTSFVRVGIKKHTFDSTYETIYTKLEKKHPCILSTSIMQIHSMKLNHVTNSNKISPINNMIYRHIVLFNIIITLNMSLYVCFITLATIYYEYKCKVYFVLVLWYISYHYVFYLITTINRRSWWNDCPFASVPRLRKGLSIFGVHS